MVCVCCALIKKKYPLSTKNFAPSYIRSTLSLLFRVFPVTRFRFFLYSFSFLFPFPPSLSLWTRTLYTFCLPLFWLSPGSNGKSSDAQMASRQISWAKRARKGQTPILGASPPWPLCNHPLSLLPRENTRSKTRLLTISKLFPPVFSSLPLAPPCFLLTFSLPPPFYCISFRVHVCICFQWTSLNSYSPALWGSTSPINNILISLGFLWTFVSHALYTLAALWIYLLSRRCFMSLIWIAPLCVFLVCFSKRARARKKEEKKLIRELV